MHNQPSIPVRRNPTLRYLKEYAKSTLRQHKSGLRSCCAILGNLRKFSGASPDEILTTRVTLQQVQHAIALSYGYKNWVSLRDAVAMGRQSDKQPLPKMPRKYKRVEKMFSFIRKWRAPMSRSDRSKRRGLGEKRITDAISKGKFDNLKGKNKPLTPANFAHKPPKFLRNVDQVIAHAIKKGDFDNLPGKGQPLDLESYFKLPKESRLAFHLLKNAGYVPSALLIHKEIVSLKERLSTTRDEKEKGRLIREIDQKKIAFEIAKANQLK